MGKNSGAFPNTRLIIRFYSFVHIFLPSIKGLEDQLLGRVIVTEKKELEIERTNLIQGVTSNKRKIKELEANLLHKLSTVEVLNCMKYV